ncbi:hypothetical protein ACSTJ6_02755 [Vibrio parahaemolyticus]|uniref:hypothetical protein n=1 Tax=Vibrio harveyi group TaxID=717610 RepID=UPI001A2467A3|nr:MULTISPECIES: hypothetical protein [Vibrio harveyi group]EHI9302102.1 hypothetical protein [Vibrio vulnificus]HAV1371956.1 hypothetical protein [Vibrio parahaemolyticus]ELA7387984.1 hypothetical protein [Vibrio alginolyticus]MCR9628007.1 hypothetical protein [Vibrio antiquarius]MCR9631631.1 hypothetical protein [Vibrio antiquarius]
MQFKPYLFGFVLLNERKIGSCVPFQFNNEVYALTCGHVLFGLEQDTDLKGTDKVKVETHFGCYSLSSVVTSRDFSKEHDLALLKLEVESKEHFLELEFSSISVNPLLTQHFYLVTKHLNDANLADVSPLKIETPPNLTKHQYLLTFEKQVFMNYYVGAYSDDAFKGISGSGLFYCSGDKVVLSGIILSLGKSSIESHGTYVGADVISSILVGLNLFDIKQLDEDRNVIGQILSECVDKTHDESINNWISAHSNESDNIVRKMQTLYDEGDVPGEVKKVVSNFLDGDRIVKNWKKNNTSVYNQYQESTYVTASEHHKYTVNSKSKAQQAYRELLKQHKDILNDSFSELNGKKVPLKETTLVANRDLSQWLAICDLNFTIE